METRPFYEIDGDRYISQEITRGPWDHGAQHAGPPAALLGREIERVTAASPGRVGRVTFELLGSVPIAPLTVSAEIVRGGRSVEMIEAELAADGKVAMRARAWRIREKEIDLEGSPDMGEAPPPVPKDAETIFFPTGADVGYHTAMDVRFVSGGFLEIGPAKVWMRMKHPLVTGEEPSQLTRVLVAADAGNGVSATLDFRKFVFINVDLSVHLHRMPAGEWVHLDAVTYPQPDGIGMSDTVIADETGPIGRAAQTLLVDRR